MVVVDKVHEVNKRPADRKMSISKKKRKSKSPKRNLPFKTACWCALSFDTHTRIFEEIATSRKSWKANITNASSCPIKIKEYRFVYLVFLINRPFIWLKSWQRKAWKRWSRREKKTKTKTNCLWNRSTVHWNERNVYRAIKEMKEKRVREWEMSKKMQ